MFNDEIWLWEDTPEHRIALRLGDPGAIAYQAECDRRYEEIWSPENQRKMDAMMSGAADKYRKQMEDVFIKAVIGASA